MSIINPPPLCCQTDFFCFVSHQHVSRPGVWSQNAGPTHSHPMEVLPVPVLCFCQSLTILLSLTGSGLLCSTEEQARERRPCGEQPENAAPPNPPYCHKGGLDIPS
jgi:hypothetical protein